MFSPGDWVAAAARRFPDRAALKAGGQSWTYAELDAHVGSLVERLQDTGVRRGDRLATVLENGILAATLPHAAVRLGATLVPLNLRLSDAEIAWQLEHCRPRLVVRGETDWSRSDVAATPESGASGALAIIYTSGTTGRPKGAMLSAGNFAASGAASAGILGVRDDDTWLAVLPLFHVGGLSILFRSAMQGTGAVVHPRFDAAAVNRAIDDEGVTIVSLVPVTLDRLLDDRGDRPFPATLRCVLVGGAAVGPALLGRAREAGVPIATTYGLTEATSQVATLLPKQVAAHAGASGRPLPGTEIRIDGSTEGEILVRGPTVMSGYLDDPAATANAIRNDWLHTGDIGRIDDDGFLYVLDRRDDLIVSGGENVYPVEVEAVLATHPSIEECAVIGEPDARWGQRVVAVVRLRAAKPVVTAEEIAAFCRTRIAGYKVPRSVHFTREPLPRTASGKLQRSRVRDGFQ